MRNEINIEQEKKKTKRNKILKLKKRKMYNNFIYL